MVSSHLKLSPNRIKHQELAKHTDEIVDLYLNKNKTLREIGFLFGTDKNVIKRILLRNNVSVRYTGYRQKTLTCIDCNKMFLGREWCALRCIDCRVIEGRREAKERFRHKYAKHKLHNDCIKCGISLHHMKLDRKSCDDCRSRDRRYMKYRDLLLKQCNNACVLCGHKEDLTIDHKIPLSRGGSNTIENLTILCHTCNCRKGTKTLTEFEASLT